MNVTAMPSTDSPPAEHLLLICSSHMAHCEDMLVDLKARYPETRVTVLGFERMQEPLDQIEKRTGAFERILLSDAVPLSARTVFGSLLRHKMFSYDTVFILSNHRAGYHYGHVERMGMLLKAKHLIMVTESLEQRVLDRKYFWKKAQQWPWHLLYRWKDRRP